GGAYMRGPDLGAGVPDFRRGAGRDRSHLLRPRQLHNARLRRCLAIAGLAAAWADDGDERRADVRLVDRGHLRGAAPDHHVASAPTTLWSKARRRDEPAMTLDRLINALVTITLIEMMVLIGLRVTFAELLDVAKDWHLVARAALANYLLVPALAI